MVELNLETPEAQRVLSRLKARWGRFYEANLEYALTVLSAASPRQQRHLEALGWSRAADQVMHEQLIRMLQADRAAHCPRPMR